MTENDIDRINCHCDENVVLETVLNPDVLLFDEYAEMYENEIHETRIIVGETKEYLEENLGYVVESVGTLLQDTEEIKGKIDDVKDTVIETSSGVVSSVNSNVDEKAALIRADITAFQNSFRECSVQDIYEMFDDASPEPIDDGLLHLGDLTDIDSDGYIVTGNFTIDNEGYILIPDSATIEEAYIV